MAAFHAKSFDPDTDVDREKPDPEDWIPVYSYAIRSCDLLEWLAAQPRKDIPEHVRRSNIAANLKTQQKMYPTETQEFVAAEKARAA